MDGSDKSGGRLRHHSESLSREFFGLKLLKLFSQRFLVAGSLRTDVFPTVHSLGEDRKQPKITSVFAG